MDARPFIARSPFENHMKRMSCCLQPSQVLGERALHLLSHLGEPPALDQERCYCNSKHEGKGKKVWIIQ
jgi:hypothetical protein